MIDVVLLPELLDAKILPNSQVVVLDVLRATSSIVTALAAAAREVRVAASAEEAMQIKAQAAGPVVLGGERDCKKIPGFDIGNSPAEYVTHQIGGAIVIMTTTNGTRALLAAQGAKKIFAGALLNASATAQALHAGMNELHTVLLCAGTDGRTACEDVIGAGAILWQLLQQTFRADLPFTDSAWIAYHTFGAVRQRLPAALRLGQGAINLIENGFEDDIDLCAALDTKPLVAQVMVNPMRVVRMEESG